MTTILQDNLRQHTNFLITQWVSSGQNKEIKTVAFLDTVNSWWSNLFAKSTPNSAASQSDTAKYLLNSINDFVEIALKTLGLDKEKFTQLVITNITTSFGQIYDATIKLPWWISPFASKVRTLIVTTMCPIMIEFLLDKYIFGGKI